jgi:hypothetical protein
VRACDRVAEERMAEILRKGQRGTLTCCCRATFSRNFEATTVVDRARAGAGVAGAASGVGGSRETRERQTRWVEKGEIKIR